MLPGVMGHQIFLISCFPKLQGTTFLSCLTVYKREKKVTSSREHPLIALLLLDTFLHWYPPALDTIGSMREGAPSALPQPHPREPQLSQLWNEVQKTFLPVRWGCREEEARCGHYANLLLSLMQCLLCAFIFPSVKWACQYLPGSLAWVLKNLSSHVKSRAWCPLLG